MKTAAEEPVTRNPYRGLLYYQLADISVFFGRDKDIENLLAVIDQSSFAILYSESGAGKTSLLQAGIVPYLIASGDLPIYIRSHDKNPSLAIKRTFIPDLSEVPNIFYYAVLSEVSPPTALSPFAAAAITGGDPYKTTLLCWKYTVPAFLVPFMFVLDASGQGLLLMGSAKALAVANSWSIAEVTLTAAVGIAALAGGFQGWAFKRTTAIERWMLITAGIALVYPGRVADAIGFGLVIAALAMQYFRRDLQSGHTHEQARHLGHRRLPDHRHAVHRQRRARSGQHRPHGRFLPRQRRHAA